MGFKDKKNNIMEVQWKIEFLERGSRKGNKKQDYLRGLAQFAYLKMGLAKNRGRCFRWGWYPDAHYVLAFNYCHKAFYPKCL